MEADLDMNGNKIINVGDVEVGGVNILTSMQDIYDDYEALTSRVTISTSSPTVVSIRLTDVSKSGKTCTAVFKWAHGGNASQEEKVNVEKVKDMDTGGKHTALNDPIMFDFNSGLGFDVFGKRIDSSPTWVTCPLEIKANMNYLAKEYLNGASANAM